MNKEVEEELSIICNLSDLVEECGVESGIEVMKLMEEKLI